MPLTQRDKVEKVLLDNFTDTIQPLNINDLEKIDKFKDGSFGFSFLALLLYANGNNLRGKSSTYPNGLLYYDSENIFGIGFFKKELEEQNGHIHIIAPRGKSWLSAVNKFIGRVKKLQNIPPTAIYVRHLNKTQYKKLIQSGFLGIETNPWHKTAPSEDETYNHRFITLEDIIQYDEKGNLVVRILKSKDSKNFRKKARSAYLRFENFLARNKLKLDIQPKNDKNKDDAENILKSFFRILNSKKDEVVLSTVEDYLSIVQTVLPEKKEKPIFFSYVGYLQKSRLNIPAMFFAGERINEETVALYATFSLRDKNILPKSVDSKGFTAISQYCYLKIFDILYRHGIKFVDLGGSEIVELDTFKRQLGAKKQESFWVVKA